MGHDTITVQVQLHPDQAWALAQLLKRIGFSDCRALAQNDEQAYHMLYAAERLRRALAQAGIAPR
jgi:hypothetical protein